MKPHASIPWCWTTDNLAELMRSIALNSPALIFCDTINDKADAITALRLAGIEPVVVIPEEFRRDPGVITAALRFSHNKHNRAIILGRGFLTGWFCNTARCVVMWKASRWTVAEMSQAHGRIRHASVGFTRTFVYEEEL